MVERDSSDLATKILYGVVESDMGMRLLGTIHQFVRSPKKKTFDI